MSKKMAAYYDELSVKFDGITLREQLMVVLCGVVLVAFAGYFFMLEPQFNALSKNKTDITRKSQELSALNSQIQEVSAALRLDPNVALKSRIADIQQAILEVDGELNAQMSSLVPANKMPKMLENVLTNSNKLNIVSLSSIAPVAVSLGKPNDTGVKETEDIALYRHGLKLVLEGSYFEIQTYLHTLESLPWQFYWNKFDYTVNEYPKASIELEIYTLSTNKAFIGV